MSDHRSLRVGLLVGREKTFPPALIDAINVKGQCLGVSAEMAVLEGTLDDESPRHGVLVDRISHEVPYYRAHVKAACLNGVVVINDPFWWDADAKFFDVVLARRLGVAVPRTVALPNKEYVPGISHDESLRNLRYPLDWDRLIDYVGFPAVLKPELGGGWRDVTVVRSREELLAAYDRSGCQTMILQEFVDWDDYLRCICIGGEVFPLRYDPRASFDRRYVTSNGPHGVLRARAEKDARTLVDALGYDVDTVEFAVKDGTLYAIDFMNPPCDLDRFAVGEDAFRWAVDKLSNLTIAYALGRRKPPWRGHERWCDDRVCARSA
jgi:glutathione synthase/RimK-type ligase-like ATP-grasp enzyme